MAALDVVIAQYFRKRGLQKSLLAFAEESQFKDGKKVEEDLENIYNSYLSSNKREVADAAEKPSAKRKAKKELSDAVIVNGEADGMGKETKKKGRNVKKTEKKVESEGHEGSEPVDAAVVTSDAVVETVVAEDRTEPDAPAIQEDVDEPPPSKKKKGKKVKSEMDPAKASDKIDEKQKISAGESNGALKEEPSSKQKKGKKADKSKVKEPVEIAEADHGTVKMEVDAEKGSEAEGLLDPSNESSKKKKKKGGDAEVKAEVVGHEEGKNVAVEQDANTKKKKGKKEKTELPANGKHPVDSAETKLEADLETNDNDNSSQEVSRKKKAKKITEEETKEPVKESMHADGNPVTEAAEKHGKRKRKNKEEGEEVAEGDGKTAAKAFQRVKPDEVEFLDPRLQDNSYWAKDGAEVGWGAKAQEVLGQVKGRGFRHEKTKKKRGSYKGGIIDLQSHSIKFDDNDSSSCE